MRPLPFVADFLALLYPTLCLACDQILLSGEHECCTPCRTALPYLGYHLPHQTTAPTDTPLARRFWGKVPVRHALGYLQFTPQGAVQQLLHRLKYENQPDLARMLGRWFGTELAGAGYGSTFHGLVPVPMHPAKQRRRGYNQATCFAEGLAVGLHLPIWEAALTKVTNAESQTRKSRLARWQNVGKGYAASAEGAAQVRGQHVLLVDDVLTTGATLEACTASLLAAGAGAVSIATIAAAG